MVERKEYFQKAAVFLIWGNEMIILIQNWGSRFSITKYVYNRFKTKYSNKKVLQTIVLQSNFTLKTRRNIFCGYENFKKST